MSKTPSFKDMLIKNGVILNPVLVQLAGLCPVVAASSNLKNAVVLSLVACAELIAVCVIASAAFKKMPRWARVPLYFVIGLVLICPVLWYVETRTLTALSLGMKIFIPLIAINSVVAVRCEQFAVKNSVKLAFYDAVTSGIGASVVFVVAGALREILGSGSIGGIALDIPVQYKGFSLPFGCLVLLGFMAAALKAFVAKKYPDGKAEPEPVEEKQEKSEPEAVKEPEQTPVPEVPAVQEPEITDAEEIKIRTEDEIEEFFRSLGLDVDSKGDEQ